MNRYSTNGEEGEILHNLLGLTDEEAIHNAEFEGFLTAEILFTENLTPKTKFTIKYICDIHRTALKELYSFAGHFRSVNVSKGGFVFPAGRFIPDNMRIFEEEILAHLPDHYAHQEELIKDIAKVHGELLFIHPFREGNGRTARILANLMARKQGYTGLNFRRVNFDEYIIAVQQVARKDYSRMEKIITYAF
ncbi:MULTISPECIES: Fic family protein [Butyricimonas]|uniref:protein adenylyltransferase n=1 Tax=Butyricimonas hominis TaxID=2763032 RepID=A0ABR7D3T9_9BACT|nr:MULTISPECIES: Fic family protein [Butyricimonas]MBC5622489.1 Fic family protein [Butyricimonas hominis]